jgi:hypothetical protein
MIHHSLTPRPITEREQRIIQLYAYCELAMTPQEFYAKWDVQQEAIALICSRSVTTVRRWFARGERHRHPQPQDLRHLALMNFLLEHFEAIPPELRQQLCLPNS